MPPGSGRAGATAAHTQLPLPVGMCLEAVTADQMDKARAGLERLVQ
ncbi:hypothetical protein [Erythrobacter dokdonensis]|uniref:Uncharacterized protein n=1 Tax=Erythrobacter dokdonensis DSW-74 TaxID=1300349 RepID=A0A1A7BFB1_9SPHN|nr:hypothetical protein [Erythrobacter dokdonensis]OBV10097.1 hypothetical protein I603_2658 [Erythrobacter dokdonensis DSW-74]